MTSIEWLIKELYTEMNMSGDGRVLDEILKEAKEMHKQEMGDTWDAAIFRNAQRGYNASRTFEDFDDYYQETFVSKGSDELELPKHPSVISENGNELLFDKEGNLIKELPQEETLYTEEQVKEELIGFQIFLNNKGLITNHDWDFEKRAKQYIKSLK